MNDFTERYKTHSNLQLLKIIENAGSYEPAAVTAAKTIFESRQLTKEEIAIARQELSQEQDEIIAQQQKKKIIVEKLKNMGTSVADTIDPVQKTSPTAGKLITIVSIVFALYFGYRIYREFDFLVLMLSENLSRWDMSSVMYLVPLFLLPVAVILYYLRKKSGWFLLAICISHALAITAFNTWIALTIEPSPLPLPDFLQIHISPVTIITTALFFGSCLWAICRNDVREIYAVTKAQLFAVIGLTVAATIFVMY
jgi:hypothetical protein